MASPLLPSKRKGYKTPDEETQEILDTVNRIIDSITDTPITRQVIKTTMGTRIDAARPDDVQFVVTISPVVVMTSRVPFNTIVNNNNNNRIQTNPDEFIEEIGEEIGEFLGIMINNDHTDSD